MTSFAHRSNRRSRGRHLFDQCLRLHQLGDRADSSSVPTDILVPLSQLGTTREEPRPPSYKGSLAFLEILYGSVGPLQGGGQLRIQSGSVNQSSGLRPVKTVKPCTPPNSSRKTGVFHRFLKDRLTVLNVRYRANINLPTCPQAPGCCCKRQTHRNHAGTKPWPRRT